MANRVLRALVHPAADTARPDLMAVACAALEGQVAALEAGRARLRVPRLQGQMRVIRGMHFHLMPELFLQLSGFTTFEFPAESFRVVGGELCIVPRGMPHGETVGARSGPFYNLVFMFHRQVLTFHLAHQAASGRPQMMEARRIECPTVTRLADYLDDASELFHARTYSAGTALKGTLLAHFALLLGILKGRRTPPKNEPFRIAQTRQFVMSHLHDPELSVRKLAEWVRCSPDYLSYVFHRETGTSLARYINEQRVAQARHLLGESTLNIKEIAAAAGFADPGYFTRLFRRMTGQAPRDYRKGLPKNA